MIFFRMTNRLTLTIALFFFIAHSSANNLLRGVSSPEEHEDKVLEDRNFRDIENDIPIGNDFVVLKNNNTVGSRNPRIVGGFTAKRGEQRNFAMLLAKENGGYRFGGCGGTLISNCHVLTAAHCVADDRPVTKGVFINAYQPFNGNGNLPNHFTTVRNIKLHPSYDSGDTYNDVAIITLSTCVSGKAYFLNNIMKLADSNYMRKISDGKSVTVSGFGAQKEGSNQYSKTLRMVQIPYISNEICKRKYVGKFLMKDEVCAGLAEGGKDACQGDSGGPLFTNDGNGQYQIGIVSWGSGCARPSSPGIYSSVAYHYNFIKKQVCQHSRSRNSALCNDYTTTSAKTSATTTTTETPTNGNGNNNGSSNGSSNNKSKPALAIVGDNGSPSSFFPLKKCEGDCDRDRECSGDLVCFQRNDKREVPGCSGTGYSGRDFCTDPELVDTYTQSKIGNNGSPQPISSPTFENVYVSCGKTGACGSVDERVASINEKHEVRCCADTAKHGWRQNPGCTVWGESILLSKGGLEKICHHSATYFEASIICESNGARLCTRHEVLQRCTSNSGCNHDFDLIWTSTPVL